jgi:NAD+ diphosphatase
MLGFFATVKDDTIRMDTEELEDARWFSRAELENPVGFFYPPPYSLAHHLIRAFMAEQ